MGWKQYARSVQADQRRTERAASKRHRELVKQRVAAAVKESAATEVALFESYLEVLVSVHKEGGEIWDWTAIRASGEPLRPSVDKSREAAARRALNAFRPTLIQRLFGGEAKVRSTLEQALREATSQDSRQHEQTIEEYRHAHAVWTAEVYLAEGVLRQDMDSYKQALHYSGMTDELAAFKTRVVFEVVEPDVIALNCVFEDEDLVPREESKLTSTGKVSTKAIPAGKYWALYQDHVCSCALRVARESLGVLPVSRVVVNVQMARLDTSTGHIGTDTILAVIFPREIVERLNLVDLDPSDSLRNFPHRMKFKKTAGFDSVEPMTADEQWVST